MLVAQLNKVLLRPRCYRPGERVLTNGLTSIDHATAFTVATTAHQLARWSIHAVEALAADAVPLARGADHARGLCAEPIATRLGARTIEARVARLDAHARDAVEPWLAPTACDARLVPGRVAHCTHDRPKSTEPVGTGWNVGRTIRATRVRGRLNAGTDVGPGASIAAHAGITSRERAWRRIAGERVRVAGEAVRTHARLDETAWIGVARRTHGRDHGAHALLAHRNLAGAAGETALRRRAATRWTALAASPEQWDQQSESESNVGHAPAHQIEWTRRFCERQAREVCRDVCFLRRRRRVVDATTVRAHACARWSVPILVS
jgi:hypothetical protein